ncbi:hypothetical protein TNIN_463461 [Trichonephila inaurata madagascariensis]|uniref:Mitochondrial protein n=1 Tax=Trichonephila inaurata madagascariensis TaxID=2747483 RepID=A0A8X7C2Z1_9ARAC|nr:hypothetical protein TNIN_463461 [Trichonephila inaurata madagascariensis]
MSGPNTRDVTTYRSLIGCLSYLAARTRPGILYALNLFCQLQSDPDLQPFCMLLKILGYVYTTECHLHDITCTESFDIPSYCDADYAANKDSPQTNGGFKVFVESLVDESFVRFTETSKNLYGLWWNLERRPFSL